MKVLKIEDNNGYYRTSEGGDWRPIDEIDKEGLMGLLNCFLEKEVEIEDFDEKKLSNQAQQIVYKSIHDKFASLLKNKSKFKDESERMYLDAVKKYQI